MFFARTRKRSFGLRLALVAGGFFIASTALLLILQSIIALDAVREELGDALQAESAFLLDRGNDDAVAKAVAQAETDPRSRFVYLLRAPDGHRLAGGLPSDEDWGVGLVDGRWPPSVPRRAGFEEDATSDRILTYGATTAGGGLLVVGINGDNIADAAGAMWYSALVGLPIAALLGFGGAASVSARYRRRVERISSCIRQIMGDPSSQRMAVDGSGDEVDQLSRALNDMLDRQARSAEGLRQISTDIAHELRTPLSRLRQMLDATSLLNEREQIVGAIQSASDEAQNLLNTFAALLRIAQIEGGAATASFTRVDLSSVLSELADIYGPVAEDSQHRIEPHIAPGIAIRGDRALLVQMFANLIENAIRHTPPGSTVTLALDWVGSRPVAAVEDDGPGIPATERGKVLTRFYRLDTSRSTSGSGLGLAMVAAVASVHQANLEFEDAEPGLRVAIRFEAPLANGAVAAPDRAKVDA